MWLNSEQLPMAKRFFPIALLLISMLGSGWFYWESDSKVEQLLTSKEWQSMSTVRIDTDYDDMGPLKRADIKSNVVYLPNKTYSKSSTLTLFSGISENVHPLTINVMETGNWDYSGDYLLIDPTEFKDVTANDNKDFSGSQKKLIMRVFRMDAQQSKRVDVVNDKTLLLTSLNYGSGILFSH
ncbi:regulatory protein ToxS [Aliivibrio sp. S3MY1]|uniref:regulatory protein ToxS n=1 Tax=unclassified Aliivibrio TaxID=2645654 RepID=UPI0023780A01|nr:MULTISPECIES: regulatory protein ToxS [unclassified Aliivibrio]MDD9195626.1 regulatory protein ToxS [Aliivibrio sp. S3MY1]MDD9199049.1 regulatory protein ToxS [Aliivibrio sp. S2MY1]